MVQSDFRHLSVWRKDVKDRRLPFQLLRLLILWQKANFVLLQRVRSQRRSRGLIRKRTLGCLPLITIRETLLGCWVPASLFLHCL